MKADSHMTFSIGRKVRLPQADERAPWGEARERAERRAALRGRFY